MWNENRALIAMFKQIEKEAKFIHNKRVFSRLVMVKHNVFNNSRQHRQTHTENDFPIHEAVQNVTPIKHVLKTQKQNRS